MTGYLTYDANTARLDDLHRRAGRNAVTQIPARDAQRATASPHRMRLRPRWAYRAA